jgi:hypothetical protein
MPYELYSETLGDWPLVAYYSMAWLMVFPLIERLMPDCPAKLRVIEKKDPEEKPITQEEIKDA